jgi:hypothetical protein
MQGQTPTPMECIARAEWFEAMAAQVGSTVAAGVFRNRGREWRAIAALTSEAERAQRVKALDVWMKTPTPLECIARAERFEAIAERLGPRVAAGVFRNRGREWRAIAALTSEAERAQRVMVLDALDADRIAGLPQSPPIDKPGPLLGFN